MFPASWTLFASSFIYREMLESIFPAGGIDTRIPKYAPYMGQLQAVGHLFDTFENDFHGKKNYVRVLAPSIAINLGFYYTDILRKITQCATDSW